MRNVFLILVLANLLLLAWQFWVEPPPSAAQAAGPGGLAMFGEPGPGADDVQAGLAGPDGPGVGARPAGNCLRVGPLPDSAAAQQAAARLVARGIDAVPLARDTQLWLGHWVQIGGFASVPAAETARQRLVTGGLADAYLMQDGSQPVISLGVFRDRGGADRVVGMARTLGFEVSIRDRYRPAVEEWLLIRPRPDQSLDSSKLRLADDRIMRTERTPCDVAGAPVPPAAGAAAPGPLR